MDYTQMHADSLSQRAKRREHANTPAKSTWKQQLIAAAKANGIRETPQDAVIRLYGQYQKTRNASYKLVLQTRIKTICDRHKWPYPGNIA